MEVLLNIPDKLFRYVEYIPKEVLPDILIEVIEKGILSQEVEEKPVQQVSLDLTQVLSLLQQQSQGIMSMQIPQVNTPVITQKEESGEIDVSMEYVELDDNDVDMDDDTFDDFMK